MTYKRYQYWSRTGVEWTDWFRWDSDNRDPWQLKNRLRAADYGEIPFVIKNGDSFVMIEKYTPSDDGIDNYTTSRVEGKGFGGKVLSDIMEMGINITPD